MQKNFNNWKGKMQQDFYLFGDVFRNDDFITTDKLKRFSGSSDFQTLT